MPRTDPTNTHGGNGLRADAWKPTSTITSAIASKVESITGSKPVSTAATISAATGREPLSNTVAEARSATIAATGNDFFNASGPYENANDTTNVMAASSRATSCCWTMPPPAMAWCRP